MRPGTLHIYRSNRAERLVDALSEVVSRPRDNPLTPETLVVQGRGMEVWLNQQLSTHLGVFAGAEFLDLALMTKLVKAVQPDAQLILVGDKDQLASVEAGAILGDIFNEDADHRYSDELVERVGELAGTALPRLGAKAGPQDCVVHLERSFRYRADGGIGALARAINSGRGSRALEPLQGGGDELSFEPSALGPQGALEPSLARALVAGFQPVASATRVEE